MFVSGELNITSQLENIHINTETNMQPKSDRPPVCPKGQLPKLHLTPSGGGQKRNDGTQQAANSPWLLKPQHVMPPTPPPQTDPQPLAFFPKRMG